MKRNSANADECRHHSHRRRENRDRANGDRPDAPLTIDQELKLVIGLASRTGSI
jgi:hypothetical protein